MNKTLFDMCYCLYIATTKPQPTSELATHQTELYLEEPTQMELENLRLKFTNPYIYYVGSYSNCSCWFNLPAGQAGNPDWIRAQRSVARLINLIRTESEKGILELYSCWTGNTDSVVEEYLQLKASSILLDNYFEITENQLITFRA
ncbi:hypothetical protein [Spirosoma gilvum]